MLRTSSSTDLSTSAAQSVVEYDGVDDGGGEGKSVEKSSKVEEPQRPEKSAKAIGSEEPSFLTSDTRLAVAKMSPSRNSVQNSRWRITGHCCSFQEVEALPGSRKPIIIASDGSEIQRAQALVRGARKIFEPRTLESFTSYNQRSLCTKVFICGTHILDTLWALWHQDNSRTCCARSPSATSILEMRSKRRRPSPGSG